ncbi:biopolymer transporter ExbD [Opitutus sp. ER46]|uniref:ExbD/TolR family protein n=1 Tax=Opitutus sp. ER46 TaxID=2161864 RepID=UPI000D30CE07|nr:biopolymer transporter ExbD [Opitutus sp. ER46]PTX96478.1 biopolymer transporter ExbD [Opitutus sp. ER46]
MAGSTAQVSGRPKKARIEIIPLIDVIFFLLATFVLFTLSLNKTQGIRVTLPQVFTGEPRATEGTHTISVTEQGTLAWDTEFVNLDEFLRRLQVFHTSNPDGRILINGDENASFNAAVYVFDEARKAGFEKVLIETKVRQAK